MTEPCDLTAVAARALIGRRALGSAELVDSCVARIEAVDHAVNAMVARDFDRARIAARAADAATMRGDSLGALHGVPVGIKDTEDTAGLRTTYGSPIFADHVPDADQGAVARIRAAGGIVLGKTNVPEFAAGANTRNAVYGATGNPFDPTRSAAGSSGGSAVALATGMAPLATGSDLGGSLRNPAAFCGVVGFRPSPGMVPNERRLHGWSPLSVLGPMARTAGDAALLLSVMASGDARDPLALGGLGPVQAVDLSRLRVALTPDFGFAPTERAIARVFADRTASLRQVFAVADDTSPDCAGTDESFAVLRAMGMVSAHADRARDRPRDVGPNIHANLAEAATYTLADVARAATVQTSLYQRWQAFFTRFDVILSPAITISPRPWTELFPAEIDGRPTRSYYHWLALAYAASLVGHPALSLPVGVDGNGMPFGLQIVGPRGGDALVLGVAASLEALLGGDPATARPVPDLARLAAAPPLRDSPGFLGFG